MSNADLVRFSRDGDQFHYLWAARRCLQLLSARSGLVAVSVEGPSPSESGKEPAVGAGDEVIDVAEYLGSQEIQNATLVRYMQLKHSTQRATEAWTASGLEKTIEGFARRHQKLRQSFSAAALQSKVEFWFVTNRSIAVEFSETVADAASGTSPRHVAELAKLERFTGLSGDELGVFAKLLHFEDRQDAYWEQRHLLFQDIRGYLPEGDADAPLKLKELVLRRALSEGRSNPTITKMDVLRALDTDESQLFPAPCLINVVATPVSRAQESELLNEIVRATEPVIIHASAGVGKTVFATHIEHALPNGSVCILYDCFGNGQYRNASGYRHRHRDALVQIANELATKGLCHPLIPTARADASAYVRAFVHRVNQAATLLRLHDPQAILCIVVDAADNAQMAAEEIGEPRSFVRDLIREKMPDNVRLVFLCRSHRQAYLDPPVETVRRELLPFSRDETAAYLRQRFPEASDYDIDEFHRLSSQNPRVQALALSRNNSLPETLRLLGPNPTTVEDTIGSLLEGAIALLRDNVGPIEKVQVDKICAGLAALRPLIPIPVLAKISGVEEGAIRSFAIDLGRPLLVAGDTIQFFDEPAETWFRERFKPSAAEMADFIASLKPLAAGSAYVASVLPQLMLEAGKFAELVELALTSGALPETSPLERRDVELQRLQFALKAGLRSKRYLDAAKLAMKAGGETAGDDRQRKILQANTDLAATFLGTDLLQEIVSRRTFGSGWVGSHHAYEAALLSGRSELVGDARSRLRMAYEWLRNWSRLTPDERKKEEVSDQDIAELTLARINIHGPKDGAQSLATWRPREVSFRVGRTVGRRLIDHGRIAEAEALARAAENNLCLVLAIAVELREIQHILPSEVVRRAFKLVVSPRVKLRDGHGWDQQGSALNAVTALVEAALQVAACPLERVSGVLSRYLPDEPPRALSSRFSPPRFPLLRAYCLRAALEDRVLELRDLAHAELRVEMDKKNQHSTSRDLREFQENIGALLPWHQLWAAVTLGRVTQSTLSEEIKRTREASRTAARMHYRDDVETSNEIALVWFDLLHKLEATTPAMMEDFARWKNELRRPLFTPTLTALARLAGQREATRPMAVACALEAFNLAKDERTDAESKSGTYLDAARAILAFSKSDAHAYFNEAVEVASKIGDENLSRWDAILDLADRAADLRRPSPETAYHFARSAELSYDYVHRDKHFDWESTIRALCGLCPSSALAILSRWRDRGFGWSERILPVAIDQLIEHGSLDARDALPLISFRAQWAFAELLDRVLARCASPAEKEAAAEYLRRYAQFDGGSARQLRDVAARHGLTIVGLDEAIVFADETKAVKRQSDGADEPVEKSTKSSRNWDDVLGGCDLTTADGLSAAHAAFKGTESPWHHEELFKEVIRRVPIGREVAFIGAMAQVPAFDLYHLRSFLEQAPDAWKDRPATRQAMAATLRAFGRRHCMGISKNRHYEVLPFKTACALSGITEGEIVEVVLDAIGETPDLADANRLFSLIGLLAIKLTEDEALEALNFGLSLFTPALNEDDGDGPWSRDLLPPSDIRDCLAGYIWASMASPSGILRWEGAHAVLGIAALGRQDALARLVRLAIEKKGGPFVDASLPFYALHALQWLLIGLARAAIDFPLILAAHGKQIVEWALNDQPHVLIREFAARAALALARHGALKDSEGLQGRLASVNRSPFPVVDSKSYDRLVSKQESSPDSSGEDRYYFGIDIGPYWYSPLGRVFAVSESEVETAALTIIREDFRHTAGGSWEDDARAKRDLYKEEETYHSHGSHPRADDLRFYHAYHAMMIAAGKLLATMPTHSDREYGEENEFADWLAGHDLSRSDGRWLWDRRDPMPLEHPAWQAREDEEKWRVATDGDFDEALRPGNLLNIWGTWTVADHGREQTVHVSSALVVPDKSLALLRALSTTDSVYDYALPSAGSNHEIDAPDFSLKGWIVDRSRDRGLDRHDRWAGDIHFPAPIPADFVVDAMRLVPDADGRLWKDGENSIVLASQVWGHYDEGKRHETSNPERGSRLQMRPDFLWTVLAKFGVDLIASVQIERRRRSRSYESGIGDDHKRVDPRARLYLFSADGRLRTLEGYLGLGP